MNYRRTALQDTELAGEQIKQGDTVIVWFAAANRDETVFEEPDSFDVTRCQRESVRRDLRTFGFAPITAWVSTWPDCNSISFLSRSPRA